jgi:hypothetical protein
MAPFRESQLTRLFQDYFVGEGVASMIVNVNPLAAEFDETSQVLKMSSLAQDVVIESRTDTGRSGAPRSSRRRRLSRSSRSRWRKCARRRRS